MREIGIGVISLGWMGRLHASSYQRLPSRFTELGIRPRLVVAADPIEENQQAAIEQFGFEKAVASIEEVLADPEVDVVSICSPNFLHRDFALAAAAAGKPFWIEKPMGVSAAQSREIRDAAASARDGAGIATAVGFNYRHAPAIAHLRELVAGGRLGRITNVRCWFYADYASSPEGPLTWRYDRERGGSGVIGDLLSHGADLVQHVTGQRLAEVTATSDVFIEERRLPLGAGVGHGAVAVSEERGPVENEDWVAALARLDGGAHATLESSRVARGHRSDYALEVFGTEGSARWSFTRMNEFEVMLGEGGTEHGYTTVLAGPGHGEFAHFQPGPGIPMSFDDLKTIEAAAFLSDVVHGTTSAPSAADGLAAAEVCEAIVRSAASRAWETVPQG
ncbi:Gfo/Idh/MocA family protein [Brachybacterium saurashtrense]|uniref:Gfo/Idh/MocA family oxidoreductase n=1 Tax=Brachybacterium saurashtrense TaxID=556288 RepID=A0A345YS02_9MICO|nr:Gfo/Idh/MocA family oxidoreductase [Brachybacterium saurashtrense]AXK46704.1 gfo/Idh/MocA family oxidoreductase [Brachybacterium saurashtrense]RRR22418.1 gfo/Idh/MocA family oxidoreductase [Brachybacterium saurashtrense]